MEDSVFLSEISKLSVYLNSDNLISTSFHKFNTLEISESQECTTQLDYNLYPDIVDLEFVLRGTDFDFTFKSGVLSWHSGYIKRLLFSSRKVFSIHWDIGLDSFPTFQLSGDL